MPLSFYYENKAFALGEASYRSWHYKESQTQSMQVSCIWPYIDIVGEIKAKEMNKMNFMD